jgi:hypothetical protein
MIQILYGSSGCQANVPTAILVLFSVPVPDYCSDPVSPRGLQLLNAHSKQPRGVISDFDFLLANFFISQSNPLLQGKK